MQLRDYQHDFVRDIKAAWANGAQNVLGVLECGGGKCLGAGTPILMYDGTVRPVERIAPGDLVMGPDSRPRGIVSVCRGREMLYRVVPVKGDPYVVNESHILSLKVADRLKTAEGYPRRVVNIAVKDFLAESPTFRLTHKGWRAAVDFSARPLPKSLPPYFFGLWLGDGDSKGPSITTADPEVVEEIFRVAFAEGLRVRRENAGGISRSYHLSTGKSGPGRGYFSNPVKAALREIGVLGNKHIPHLYRANSLSVRLELLAGLLDSDGALGHCGYDYISKLEVLADDVCFLARSVGLAAYKSPCTKTCGNNGVSGQYFRVSISGDCERIPCRIRRKKCPPRKQSKSVLVTGIRLEQIGVGDYFGFEIAGPDRLFLLGDFTVTHNTVCFGTILREHTGASCAIAHRRELVGQMSTTLARLSIPHRIIAPVAAIREIVPEHLRATGRSWHNPDARTAVAGVDTITNRDLGAWREQVSLWVTDEGHHLTRANKWGKAVALFPNARGLAVTATAGRADGKGLGRRADGVMDVIVAGPPGRDLIEWGYLTDYRIFAPKSDLNRAAIPISETTGEFKPEAMREAVKKSHITGDIVESYLKIAPGKLGVTFAVSVEEASEIAARFRAAGVPAECVSADTPGPLRAEILRRFARRELLQLVNVDLFGEGFDLPALEVVSMGRPTESYPLYHQQFMRVCRPLEGKQHAIIIDHVGNVLRHGLPDAPRVWSLDRRERRAKADSEGMPQIRACPACTAVYERFHRACPFCGHVPQPASRSGPEYVDGDLLEMDAGVLARLRAAADLMKGPSIPYGASPIVAASIQKNHRRRVNAQHVLRDRIAWWAGWQRSQGRSDSEGYRRFYLQFGIDVATAQTLAATDADALTARVETALASAGVDWKQGEVA